MGSGNYGDVRQYFTDPIFYSKSGGYSSSDPAVRQMQDSMDRSSRFAPLGSLTGKSATGTPLGATWANAAGNWHLELSDGRVIDLILIQSGSRVFGRGSIASGRSSIWALASGSVTGSNLALDVVSATGTELYAITLDTVRLHLPGSYTAFEGYSEPKRGTVKASRIVPKS